MLKEAYLLQIIFLFSMLSQMDFKAMNKESAHVLEQNYDSSLEYDSKRSNIRKNHDSSKQYVSQVDNKPIYTSENHFNYDNGISESESNSENKYNLDYSENLNSFYNPSDVPKDFVFENDEVFVQNINSLKHNTKSNGKFANKCALNTENKISKGDKHINCHETKIGESTLVKEKSEAYPKSTKSEAYPKSVTKASTNVKAKNDQSELSSNKIDKLDGKIFPIDGDNLSLQEEINNIFSPNFKSFVFNPTAPNQAKFQKCKTSKNESGTCRYVQHCFLPSVVSSIDQFMNNVCIIESRFIGVCCPEFPVSTLIVKWENSLQNIDGANDSVETPEECGIGTNTRIVGGTTSTVKAFPWMVALMSNNKFFCGGALINNRYVLTAAHCTYGSRGNKIIARLGEFDMSNDEGVHEDYMVEEIKRHGQYTRLTLRNDIALLKLHKPVVFNEFVKTICLPQPNKTFIGESATLTGWGHVQGGISAFTSDVLQEASFPVVTNQECSSVHGVSVPNSFICTAAPTKDKGACNGDSGGPLMMLDEKDHWQIIGVVSWGRRGCSTKYPSVFTRVTHYLDWIKEHAT